MSKRRQGAGPASPGQDGESPFPTSSEREATRTRKRDALLLAAVRMFNERGFHATSLDDVAARLGVTKPVVYHYLGTKDRILFECVRIGLEAIRDAASEGNDEHGSGAQKLRRALVRYAETTMTDFGACVIRTGDELLVPESRAEFRRLKGEIDGMLRQLIREGIADGSLRDADVKLTAFTLAGALNWPARWYDPAGPLPHTEVAERMVDILMAGIAG